MTDTTRLEEQIAHLTRVVDELSDVVAKQDAEISRLTIALRGLTAREKERAEAEGGVILADTPPPHY